MIVSLRSCSPTMTPFSSSIRADSQASGLDRWRKLAGTLASKLSGLESIQGCLF
jgi:hypothetical protein